MKNKTAVEWLEEELKLNLKKIIIEGDSELIESLFKQAKEMEKEQIINAANTLLYRGTGPGDMWAEQYYNETYGNKTADT